MSLEHWLLNITAAYKVQMINKQCSALNIDKTERLVFYQYAKSDPEIIFDHTAGDLLIITPKTMPFIKQLVNKYISI